MSVSLINRGLFFGLDVKLGSNRGVVALTFDSTSRKLNEKTCTKLSTQITNLVY